MHHVVILGAGPAGVAAALELSGRDGFRVTVVEQRSAVGGNAGSFLLDGVHCDFGSHRFHPVAEERVLNDVKRLLGSDLLLRPRHGRIRLKQRWIHFPLKLSDLLLHLPPSFTASIAWDLVRKRLPRGQNADQNFATVLRDGLGRTMAENFYYPYVEKLWGVAPTELAEALARRRVSGSSILKILGKIVRQLPGLRSETSGKFYYPRHGFGQICDTFHQSALQKGANFIFNARVCSLVTDGNRAKGIRIEENGVVRELAADTVWSTLPISLLARLAKPEAPKAVLESAANVRFRGMILVYLTLGQDQFSEYDAHYFPEASIPISRMSEPKNYSASREPRGRTVLCAELPSDPCEPEWAMDDETLGRHLTGWLESVGLPVVAPVLGVTTRRLRQAYPVYDQAYESHFKAIDKWVNGIDHLLTFGRQGLFAHDNTHHAMAMAYAACECLDVDGRFDKVKWSGYRQEFETHVVED